MKAPKAVLNHPEPGSDGYPIPVEVFDDRLGPRVPLKSNSPQQWIATSGMILRCEVGSTIHGTSVSGTSDLDEIGICIEPKDTTLGLNHFENYRYRSAEPNGPGDQSVPSGPDDLDLTVYSLRKYMTLVAAGNPSLMVPLFVPADGIRFINTFGEELRANRDKLISKRAHPRFKGYLHKQKLGLLGERNTPNRAELRAETGYDRKYASHALRLGMQGCELLETGQISIPIKGQQLRFLREVRSGRAQHGQPWPLDFVLAQIEHYDRQLDTLLETSKLPEQPDWNWINTWLSDVHLRHW